MAKTKNAEEKILNVKDFEFINTFNNDLDILKAKIANQKEKSNLIMSLLDSLNKYINANKDNEEYEKNKDEIKSLIDDIEVNSKRITKNIQAFNTLEETINILNKKIIALFDNTNSNSNDDEYYKNQFEKLKSELNLYSFQINNIKSEILLNDLQLNNFFNTEIFKKYTNKFNIQFKDFNLLSDCENLETEFNTSNKSTESTVKEENTDSKKITEAKSKKANKTKLETSSFDKLLISEKDDKVYLPYSKSEIKDYLEQYPNKYLTITDVINKEFILPLSYFQKHPVIARFRETYSLIRDREMKSVFEALKYAMDLMFKYDLNPAVIAACKTQYQLEEYLNCLERNQLDKFDDFEIRFEVNPI